MQNFTYRNHTKILFGKNKTAAIKNEIPSGSHVFVTFGTKSAKENGAYEQVTQTLEGCGLAFTEFWGIEPNPQYPTLMKAVETIRSIQKKSNNSVFLLAVGGGSVIDGTKFIAAATGFKGNAWEIVSKSARIKSPLPLGCVLTLAATGSESNPFGVVSNPETKEKLSFAHPELQPRFAVLDPSFTLSLPKRQLANGLVDAFVHVCEQYLTHEGGNLLHDRQCEAILSTLTELAPILLDERRPADYALHSELMWCCNQALNGLLGCGVAQDWSSHVLGHELTAKYGIDHGRTLSIVLPANLKVRIATKAGKVRQLGERVFRTADAATTIQALEAFFRDICGCPTRLGHALGTSTPIAPETLRNIVERLKERGDLPMGESSDITEEVALEILKQAL